jgi:hypothetical protein
MGRAKSLEDLALHRTAAADARAELATYMWSDGALYHAWRLTESLRVASGREIDPLARSRASSHPN